MTDRAYVFQKAQIAREAGAGTAPASGYKQLRSMEIAPGIEADVNIFRAMGFKLPTVQALGREWMGAATRGQPDYNEIDYALSVLQQPTFATAVADPTSGSAYTRTYQMAAGSADARDTFTVQWGDSTRRGQMSYAFLTEWGVTLTRQQMQMTGTWLGQRISEGTAVAFGTAVSALVDQPILPNQFDVYLSPTYAGIGSAGNKLLRALSFGWSIKNRRGPIWVINSANTSFAADVELEPVIEIKLKVEADDVGMGLVDRLRDGATRYIRAIATGGTAIAGTAGTASYLLRSDNAVKVSAKPSGFSNESGLYAIEWTFTSVIDTDLTGGAQWFTRNILASL
jgi:hypothetical protein